MTKLAQDDADIKQGHTELKRLAYQGWPAAGEQYLHILFTEEDYTETVLILNRVLVRPFNGEVHDFV